MTQMDSHERCPRSFSGPSRPPGLGVLDLLLDWAPPSKAPKSVGNGGEIGRSMVGFFANMQTCCCCQWIRAVRQLSLAFNTPASSSSRVWEVTQTSISQPMQSTGFIINPICNPTELCSLNGRKRVLSCLIL